MRPLRAWLIRLAGLVTARGRARQFDAELQSHLEMHVEDNVRQGMTREEARRQALIALGGAQQAREAYRDRGSLPLLESLGQDARLGVRVLRKAPGFTAAAVFILALGIGANGAVFSLVNALLLRPWNGSTSGGALLGLYSGSTTQAGVYRTFSYPEYVDIREQSEPFATFFAESVAWLGLTEGAATRRVTAGLVSSNYFPALGARMAAGRPFTREEERPGSDAAVAIVNHAYWRRHARAPDIVGREIVVNGRVLTIVGVAPEGFHGTVPALSVDLWLPLGASTLVADATVGPAARVSNDRASRMLLIAGTLKPGISVAVADSRLAVLASALESAYPEYNRDQRLVLHPRSRVSLGPQPGSDAAPAVGAAVLLALSGLVLLVACLNLANMLLARGAARRQEIAVRLALGGSRGRIVRQLLVEGLLLSVMGGLAALWLAWGGATWLRTTLTAVLPLSLALDVSPDGRVLAAVAVASVASAVLFALGPAWTLSRQDLAVALKPSTPLQTGGWRRGRPAHVLVAVQLAFSVSLLVVAGVFVRASAQAASSDPGFPLAGGLVAEIDAGMIGLDATRGRQTYRAVLERVRAMRTVGAASIASLVPMGLTRLDESVERNGALAQATFAIVGADYFAALGLPVRAGREFTEAEERDPTAAPVAIVDRELARALFADKSPLGQVVRVSGDLVTIVGLVDAVRDDVLERPAAHIYVPFGRHYRAEMTLHVRAAAGSEVDLLEPVRQAILGVDERLPVLSLRTLTEHRDTALSLWIVRFAAQLFVAFGLIALVLATAGVYGLRAYLVTRRTREMNIRMALGATRQGLIRQLVGEGATIGTAGIAAGIALAVGLMQVLRQSGMLDEVGAMDPVAFTIAPLLLAATMLVASYLPARKALRADPAAALRIE